MKKYHSPARIVECASEYIFLISKNKQAKTQAIIQKSKKKTKNKEEKRISLENPLKMNLRPPQSRFFLTHEFIMEYNPN